MIAPRILHAAANCRPSAPSVLQNCSKSSRFGKLHGFASSSSLGQLNTPSFSTYTWKSKFDDILKQVSTQKIPKNAAQSPTPSPGNSLCWLRPSAVRLAKMGPSKGRGPLIAKFAPVGFKKGFGAVGLGKHTKKGFFLINSMLVPKYHFPNLQDFPLKPYVCPQTYKIASQTFWTAEEET